MIIFHHNDADGRCAAAIVKMYWQKNKKKTMSLVNFQDSEKTTPLLIEMDYSKNVPFHLIAVNEEVFLVDFSFQPEDMQKVLDITPDVTWIDHHATAKGYPYQGLPGLRDFTDKGLCGAEERRRDELPLGCLILVVGVPILGALAFFALKVAALVKYVFG